MRSAHPMFLWREAHLRTKSGGGVQLVKREQGVKGPWVAMGGYGWLWVAMGGYGWLWVAMGGYGIV